MSQRKKPPFRADHVGSLLRPQELAAARRRWQDGEMPEAAFRAVEARAIRDVVAGQRDAGLRAITDGEYQRDWWHLDFLAGFDGMELWHTELGGGFKVAEQPPLVRCIGKVGWPDGGIFVEAFRRLKAAVDELAPAATPKITIPGPGMMQLRAGRKGRRSGGLYGHGPVLVRSRRGLPAGDRRAGGRRLHLPADRRCQLRLSVRRQPARRFPRPRRETRTTCCASIATSPTRRCAAGRRA